MAEWVVPEELSADEERYLAALHAMQSGVKYEMNHPDTVGATAPKHLRVGVNNALVQQTALVRLLVEKDVITQDEYWKVLADAMEEEVARYEEAANRRLGRIGVVKFK